MCERASERVSAVERASEESSAEQANECAVRANERAEERMAQYSTRRFHMLSTQHACTPGPFWFGRGRCAIISVLSPYNLEFYRHLDDRLLFFSFCHFDNGFPVISTAAWHFDSLTSERRQKCLRSQAGESVSSEFWPLDGRELVS